MALGLIGMTARDQPLDQVDHLGNRLGRARLEIRLQRTEGFHVVVKGGQGAPGHLADRLARRLRRDHDLVVDIRDVAGVAHLIRAVDEAQQAVEHVEDDDRPGIADMGVVVNRRPADIEADIVRVDRPEEFLPAA